MTPSICAWLLVLAHAPPAAARGSAFSARWEAVPLAAAPASLDGVVPAGTRVADLRGGEVVRFAGRRPIVGRLWRQGPGLAWLDESSTLVADGADRWRWVVPLGSHESVTLAGVRGPVERAALRDPGYEWEVYEESLVEWAGDVDELDPPVPPSAVARAAWIETRAASVLLAEAKVAKRAIGHLRVAVALAGIAASRPFVAPYYRRTSRPIASRRIDEGAPITVVIDGPRWLCVEAEAPAPRGPGEAARVTVDVDGVALAGGRLPAAALWAVRIPAGRHIVTIRAHGGPARVSATLYRKRVHMRDAIGADESIDGRAAAAGAAAEDGDLAHAEALRLGGEPARAIAAFGPFVSSSRPRAAQVYAAWRLGELTADVAAAERFFVFAEARARELPARARDVVLPAIAAARARRAIIDGRPGSAAETLAAHPSLWSDPAIVAAIVGAPVDADPVLSGEPTDSGRAVARLAAAARAGSPHAAAAIRRAWFDRTAWSGAGVVRDEGGGGDDDRVSVLDRDDIHGRCLDPIAGDSLYPLGSRPLVLDVPRDPLGGDRWRTVRVTALTRDAPALDAAVVVDGVAVPVPAIGPIDELRVALAPGRRTLTARGGARLIVDPPPGSVRSFHRPDGAACRLWRRRSFSPVGPVPVELPVAAPAGSVLGLEMRLIDPAGDREIVTAVVTVDGTPRTIRLRSPVDRSAAVRGGGVTESVVIDFAAARPAELVVARRDGEGTLLVRPLVRTVRAPRWRSPDLARRWSARAVGQALAGASLLLLHPETLDPAAGDGALARAVRLAGLRLASARSPEEKARLHAARAFLLARLGRTRWAQEDLATAAELDPTAAPRWRQLLVEERPFVAPAPDAAAGATAYPIEPASAILASLARDPETMTLARRIRDGEATRVREELGLARKLGRRISTGALALAARLDAQADDPAGAAAAYAALAALHPDRRALRVAEATFRLDDAARDWGPGRDAGPATRAIVAAHLAGDAPGAGGAMLRAMDATRWRAVAHAESAAGSVRETKIVAPGIDHAVRAALVAPDLDGRRVVWLEPGLAARAVLDSPTPIGVRVQTRCVELRPHAASERGLAAGCRLSLRIDGEPIDDDDALHTLPRGRHAVEVVLAPGGLESVAAVRLLVDRPLHGAVAVNEAGAAGGRGAANGRVWALEPHRVSPRWLADADDPVTVAVLGPTLLRLELAASTSSTPSSRSHASAGDDTVTIAERGGATLATAAIGDAPRHVVVALPDERAYVVTITPSRGRAVVGAEVREDRVRPRPRIVRASAPPAPPTSPATIPAGAAPAAPTVSLRFSDDDGPGTLTVWTGLRDGALGERDTVTERGNRWGEVGVSWRRRTGDVYWRADGFGRLRTEGAESGGLGARAYWRGAPLRLEAGALVVAQRADSGLFATAWVDAAAHARVEVADDVYVIPTIGGYRRFGTLDAPDTDPVDPDVWSRFDVDHRQALFGQVRLSWEPFLDLAAHARVRAASNDDLVSIDRALAGVGLGGAVARLAWGASFDLERRFADDDREDARWRTILRLEASWSLWRGDRQRLAIVAAGAARPGERSDGYVGLSWDLTFGRGLRDYAPPESAFAGQLGPHSEAQP